MKTVKPLLFAFALTAAGAATITAGPPDRHDFERPGVTADRARREVAIAATATGLGRNELVEFVLIHDASGHDYEALATTVAKPSDVDAALRAIGLKRGRPVRHDQLAFWPKGERLAVSVGSPPGGSWSNAVPAESLIWNGATDQPMGAAGFVFTGSLDIRDPDGGAMVYAADIAAPHAIIPLYNETAAVLDVPRRSPQGATYGSQSVNAALQLPKGTPLTFTLRPLRMVGSSQMEATLTIAAGSQAPADGGPAVTMTLVSEDAGSLAHGSQFTALRTALEAIVRDGRDPFLSIHIDPQLSVDNIRACCQFLESLEDELGVRIEPPEPRHLYYKSFIPPEQNRAREGRLLQPWELRIQPPGAEPAAVLTYIEEVWTEDAMEPSLVVTNFPLASPDELPDRLRAIRDGLDIILIYVAPTVTYDRILSFVQPVLSTHGMIHIYIEPMQPGD